MSPIRRLARLVSAAALAVAAGTAAGQTPDCATLQGNTRSILPQNSANIIALETSNTSQFIYGLTQYGWVRASLSNPMNPAPFALGQHGLKFSNGGVVPMICDCWQMGTTFAAAEGPDGSARVFFDNNASGQGGGLAGQVGRADGLGIPTFGQQINMPSYSQSVAIAAIFLPGSGKFMGYLPSATTVQIVDATTVTGVPAPTSALNPIGSFNWTGFPRLKAARVTVPSLAYDKSLLVGALAQSRQIRVAEIDPGTGIPVERASVGALAEPNMVDIAVVANRIFIFSAEGLAGLNIYEYTPSGFGGTITHVHNIPGNISNAVVRGGQFPAIFMHRQSTLLQSFVDVYDTKFLTQGGLPRKAYSLPHQGAPQEGGVAPGFLGTSVEARVVTSGPVVSAYVYRIVQKRTGEAEDSIRTDKLDISCISADLTQPPAASASLVNLSAQGRSGVEATRNYFGDRWQIRDTSASGAALDQIEWDFNVVPMNPSGFAPNESGVLPGALSEVNPAYFPCDPSSNGNIRTGANCWTSIGSPASGSFAVGNRTHNVNGWSPNTFVSAGQSVLAPQAIVAGYDGATLRVLTGGQASASGSQGNVAEATAAWVFNPGGVALSGFSVTVPTTATSFSMDVIYKGGYVSRVSGAVQQVDLVPDFTLPSSAVRNNPVTLTNRMQMGPAATLNSVDYAVDQNPGDPAAYTGALAASFHVVNGTATIQAPGTVGSYFVHLRYNYTAGGARTVTVTKPLTVINQLVLTVTGPASANTGQQVTFTVNGGGASTTYAWNWGDCPFCSPPYASGPATNTHTFSSPGQYIITVRASDPSAPDAFPTATIDIIGPPPPTPPPPTPPPPTPPPTGGFSVSLTGPASGTSGSPVTFTAVASGGSGTISYAWRWGDNALSLNYVPGPSTNSYTYAQPGQFTVAVRATDSAGIQANGSVNVNIGPPSGPPVTASVSGPARGRRGQAVPFTTTVSGGVPPYTYAWRWGDTSFGTFITGPANHSHAYDSLGSFNVTVRVTDSAGQAVTAATTVTIDNAFQALIVPGAAYLEVGDDVWGTDVSVANPGIEPLSLAVAFVPYLSESATSLDLSTLNYRAIETPLAPNGGSWSQTNVVQWLHGRPDKGTLVLRYEGPVPVVNGRVYFARRTAPLGPAYGAPVEAFKADQAGRVLAPASAPHGVEAGGEQTLIGLRSTDLYRFGVTLYNSSGVETRGELRAFDETGEPVQINTDDAGTRGTVREFRIRPYQQVYLRNQDLGLTPHPNKRYVFRATKTGAEGSLVAFGAAIDTKTSDLEQFTDDTPPAVADEQGSVYLYIPGASRFNSGNGAKWRTELRAYNPASVERTLTVEYLFTGAGEPETIVSATIRVGANKLVAADDVIGFFMDEFTPLDLKSLSTTGLLRIRYSPEVPSAPMVFSARNYDDQVAGTAGTQLSVYSRREGVSVGETALYVPGAQEDTGEHVRLRTTLGVFAMDNRQTRVRLSVVKADGTVPANGTYEFVLNQPGASSHMSQIFMDRNVIGGVVNNEPMTIKTEVLEGGRAGVYVVTVDTNTRDTSFKPGRPVR